jgi:hypothetical protein
MRMMKASGAEALALHPAGTAFRPHEELRSSPSRVAVLQTMRVASCMRLEAICMADLLIGAMEGVPESASQTRSSAPCKLMVYTT